MNSIPLIRQTGFSLTSNVLTYYYYIKEKTMQQVREKRIEE